MSALRDYYDEVVSSCPDSLWVLAGYSQGAMVVAEAVKSFRHERVVYVALFGDPKLYLPEGSGLLPDACLGRNYSTYRVYVPSCRTHEGSLKARSPYVYGELAGKYGLWCNSEDYICGSALLPWKNDGHMKYSERMAQLVGILRGRLLGGSGASAMRTRSAYSGVYALLTQDVYYARPEEEVAIDASASFGLDIDIASYEWSVDGGEYAVGTATLARSFDTGEHSVTVKVTDMLDSSSEYTSKIIIADEEDVLVLPAPTDVMARKVDDGVVLDWSEAEPAAPYLWVRLNGFDLGYAPADQKSLTIADVDFDEDIVIEVAWLSEEAASEWREVGWVEEDEELEPIVEPLNVTELSSAPNTGVVFMDGALPCLVLLACLVVIRWICWK